MKPQKGLSIVAATVIIVFGLLSTLILPVNAQTPALAAQGGGVSTSLNKINVALGSVTSGNALIVVEWWGTNNNPCHYFVTPNDTLTNTFVALGSCINDGLAGAIKAYDVAASGSSGTDTVSCRWATNSSSNVRSCYVFYATSPGTISVPETNTGFGAAISVPSWLPTQGALLLATAGIQQFCAPVTTSSAYSAYSPSSECFATPYGLSGESAYNWNGAYTTASMTVNQNSIWSELVVEINPPPPSTTTTATTTTSCAINTTCTINIQGWLVPDATHLSNSILVIVLPLGVMGFTSMIGKSFHIKGDTGVYIALFGLFLGTGIAFLGNGASVTNAVPFADFVITGLLLFLWWWNS